MKPFMIDTIPDDVVFPPDRPGVLTVRAYTLGPIAYGRPVDHEHGVLFRVIPAAFLPLGLSLTYVIHRSVVVIARRFRRLFTHGVAVPGTITARRLDHGDDSSAWLADYEFTPADDDRPVQGCIVLWADATYEAAVPGAAVTVLYDPTDPAHNTIYEFSRFRVQTGDPQHAGKDRAPPL